MNTVFKGKIAVRRDLLDRRFWISYKVWDLHGEVWVRDEHPNVSYNVEVDDDSDEEDDIAGMIHDACEHPNMEDINNFSENNEEPNEELNEDPNVHAGKFY